MAARPCECKTAEEALAKGCRRGGMRMVGALYEQCSGNAPVDRPISAERSESFRLHMDSLEAGKKVEERRPKEPGLIRKALNWAQNTAEWIRLGKPVVSEAVKAERRAICVSNVCGHYNKAKRSCGICGCPLSPSMFGDMLERGNSECPSPKKLWLAVVPANSDPPPA